MIRNMNKEEYLNYLNTSSCKELLNSLAASEQVDELIEKPINSDNDVVKLEIKNPNLDSDYRLKKIVRNYEKFGNIVVGVDFDFTLVDAVTNETYQDIAKILKRGQRKEIIYCIWAANDNDARVKSKWSEADLEFNYYNESPINPGSRKPHFNILLDDSAGLKEALDLFIAFLDYLDN